MITSTSGGMRWSKLVSEFSGTETEPEEIPGWVGDIVLRGANITPKETKCAFVLIPAEVRIRSSPLIIF